uniref:Uncharacterized protein n=1 Tax=Strigamia maritima TaxID=126957 RepID=T1IYQ4_STRMM
MAGNFHTYSEYSKIDVKRFYETVQRGDILRIPCRYGEINVKTNEPYRLTNHFGVFIDEPGLHSTTQRGVIHLKVTPNRVERSFLAKVHELARQDKSLLDILAEVSQYEINLFAINSAEELFSAIYRSDLIEIDNDLDAFWDTKTHGTKNCVFQNKFPGGHYKTCQEWMNVVKGVDKDK